jgi:hypothetical protein
LRASATQTTGFCQYYQEYIFAQVVTVPPGQPIAPCPPDTPCTQTTSGTGTAATLFAPGGDGNFDVASFGSLAFGDQGCGNPPPDPNGVLQYHFSGTAVTKTIILEVSPGLVNKGIGQINVCFSVAPPAWTILAACSKSVGPPCVAHKNALSNKGAYIEITVPAGGSDPLTYEE